MRRESFSALWPLFAKGEKPAKEMTESYSALEHLRPLIRQGEPLCVLHVGDGAHARIEAVAEGLGDLPLMRTFVTFVHAHVGVDRVLARLRWDAAFTLACCTRGS